MTHVPTEPAEPKLYPQKTRQAANRKLSERDPRIDARRRLRKMPHRTNSNSYLRCQVVIDQAARVIAQNLDDAAVGDLSVSTLFDHALELGPQRLQPLDSAFHLFKLGARDSIGRVTGLVGIVGQIEQVSDCFQRKSKLSAMSDECEPFDVTPVVPTLVT